MHLQLTRRLTFHLADGRREVTGEDGRVRPLRIGDRLVVDARYLGFVFKASASDGYPDPSRPSVVSQK